MSRLLDGNNINPIPRKHSFLNNSFFNISADLEKYAILEEKGTARNLHKLNLKDSIYDKA